MPNAKQLVLSAEFKGSRCETTKGAWLLNYLDEESLHAFFGVSGWVALFRRRHPKYNELGFIVVHQMAVQTELRVTAFIFAEKAGRFYKDRQMEIKVNDKER